jgi:hypothetical protein
LLTDYGADQGAEMIFPLALGETAGTDLLDGGGQNFVATHEKLACLLIFSGRHSIDDQ